MARRIIASVLSIAFLTLAAPCWAEQATLKSFVTGSYQKILTDKSNKPFMLIIWSITCSSCLKDMALLNKIHKERPEIDMVMLSTDDSSAQDQIQQILAKNELTGIENWFFADESAQKLRYEIDPQWYGEQPRTYFLNKKHDRVGISGVLTQEDYENQFKSILN